MEMNTLHCTVNVSTFADKQLLDLVSQRHLKTGKCHRGHLKKAPYFTDEELEAQKI